MTLPKFSAITVSYNQGEFIRQTIESVLSQNYPNFEHIIVDAGSTDETLSILQSYPHLKWTSEPDRGQSHGLNKGFARATGDVIAWINSDDWYAPGTFAEVAKHIDKYPVVVGACQITNRIGTPTEDVVNTERSWFDTLKYWVFHSVPAQPGVFFRKSVFKDLGLEPDSVLDESLNFTMDFDFWLRLQERYDLSHRIPHLCAYLRNYESNKTGANMASAYREMSRVFRRHSARRIVSEQALSIVVPVRAASEVTDRIVIEASQQTVPQIEVLFSDYSKDKEVARTIRRKVLEMEPRFPNTTLRVVNILDEVRATKPEAVKRGIELSQSQFAAVLHPTSSISNDFVSSCLSGFSRDNIGLVVVGADDQVKQALFAPVNNSLAFNPAGPFNATLSGVDFATRKIAWIDSGGFVTDSAVGATESYCLKRLLIMMTHKAWQITAANLVRGECKDSASPFGTDALRLYENSAIVDEISAELRSNPFSLLRAKNGFAIVLADELWNVARGIVSNVPSNWTQMCDKPDEAFLRALVTSHPEFGPAYALLSECLRGQGREIEAKDALARWSELRSKERQSQLFGTES